MTKHYFIFIFSLALIAPRLYRTPGMAAEKKSAPSENGMISVNADWSLYSWGLYYKNLAARERAASQRDAYLTAAVHYFKEAAASGRSLDKIYLKISDCYFLRSDFRSSLEFAQKSLALDATDVRTYNRIYNIFIKMRNYEAAARILEQCLSVMPDSVQIQYILAEHYYKYMHDMDKASAAYKNAITLSDRLPVEDYYKEQSYLSLGHIAYRKGATGQAVLFYREVLKINKDNFEAVYYCALGSMEMYDLTNAERYSYQFLKKSPGNKIINSILGRIYYLREDIRAISYLYDSKSNGTLNGLLSWGLYHELLGNDQIAGRYLGSVMKFAPQTIALHIALARINSRKKEANSAFNEYVTAGILLYNSRLYPEATRCFSEALRINSTAPGVYYYMAKAYEGMHLFSLALYYIKEANRLYPDTDLMLHVGYLYGLRKDYENAMDYFNLASARDPKNSQPYFFEGLISI